MNLMLLSDFLNKSGMRKTGTGLYMFTALCILRHESMLTGPEFVEFGKWLTLALFAGNTLEHFIKSTTTNKPNVSPPPAAQ